VELPGYLSGKRLDEAIVAADALLAFTKHPDEQLSTAAEALGAGKAMVLSDTKLLHQMYYKGAVYVDALDPKSIVEGCRTAIKHRKRLELESRSLRQERVAQWRADASFIKDLLQSRLKSSTECLG
jgi:glycosyltransferase involved in cell wall biosynthesis